MNLAIFIFIEFILIYHGNITLDNFIALYGVHINTASILFHFAHEINDKIKPLHVLYFLDWIRHYNTQKRITQWWKCDAKTFHKWVIEVLFSLFVSLDSVCILSRNCKFLNYIYRSILQIVALRYFLLS